MPFILKSMAIGAGSSVLIGGGIRSATGERVLDGKVIAIDAGIGALGGVASAAHKVHQVNKMSSVAKEAMGRQLTEQSMAKAGMTVKAEEVIVKAGGAKLRVDYLARTKEGNLRGVESKFGFKAGDRPAQKIGYAAINEGGELGVLTGKNAGEFAGKTIDQVDIMRWTPFDLPVSVPAFSGGAAAAGTYQGGKAVTNSNSD